MLVYINKEYFVLQSDQHGAKYGNTEGPASWACSFEKLLDDPMGLHVFAVSNKFCYSIKKIIFIYAKIALFFFMYYSFTFISLCLFFIEYFSND